MQCGVSHTLCLSSHIYFNIQSHEDALLKADGVSSFRNTSLTNTLFLPSYAPWILSCLTCLTFSLSLCREMCEVPQGSHKLGVPGNLQIHVAFVLNVCPFVLLWCFNGEIGSTLGFSEMGRALNGGPVVLVHVFGQG